MKKLLIPIIVIILIIAGGGVSYNYFSRGPKITDSVLTKSIDANGKPTATISTTFKAKDKVCFSAKGKKFAIKKATVVWYKGEILTKNKFKVEENIVINNAGYFSAKLSLPEGLEAGRYGVTTYSEGSKIIQTTNEFDVKN